MAHIKKEQPEDAPPAAQGSSSTLPSDAIVEVDIESQVEPTAAQPAAKRLPTTRPSFACVNARSPMCDVAVVPPHHVLTSDLR